MQTIQYLEMPITHTCSLHCDGCSAYSNYNLKKYVSLEEARFWFSEWSRRVAPLNFQILGGEPFVHDDLPEIVRMVRAFWPETNIQVCTNALNLKRHPSMGELMSGPNMGMWVSVHSRDPKYLARVEEGVKILQSWSAEFGLKFGLGDNITNWNRFYNGVGREMEPFTEGDYVASWKACHSQHCLNLVDGRLWKCPQIGNLHLVAERFGLGSKNSWQDYLAYEGIGYDCSDDELKKWMIRTRGPEPVCGMCPIRLEKYEKDIYNTNYDQPGVNRVERRPELVSIAS